MRGEDGQASVEWIGLVSLVALSLAALIRLAPDAEGQSLASTVLQAVAPPQVVGIRSGKRNDSPPPAREAFVAPPLVPPPGQAKPPERRPRGGRSLLRWARPRLEDALRWARPRLEDGLSRRLRRGAGVAWRRAWLGCLAYERTRYGFLHPESRFPGHTIKHSEALRIANDCLSPVDVVRDWQLLTGR
jgi:hypothetical protein